MTKPGALIISLICFLSLSQFASGQTSALVSIDTDGKLVYQPDNKGNRIPDFSGVGYKNGEADIPVVPVVKTVTAVLGDNYSNIQNAINEVAAMSLQANGLRGAILFKSGTYEISKSVNVAASGIVLRGEGITTNFRATGTFQYNLVNLKGPSGKTEFSGTQKKITDSFVPIGAKTVTVEAGHSFVVGDWVHLRREPNDAWIHMLGMDLLTNYDPTATNWTASAYKISYERQIVAIQGNALTFDAPVVDPIDPQYANGFVVKFSSSRIQNCAVENMKMSSTYTSATDENHGWNAIFIDNVQNCWVKDVVASDFGYSCVNVGDVAAFVTVDNCSMLDPVSLIEGGRRYSFNVDGQRCLVKNCTTRNGRHDYVDGSRTPGPTVFYNCLATQQHADMGPHHRWSTGILFDNIVGDGQLRVQDRAASGSGHGWSGSQIMFWNCEATDMVVQDPQSYHCNWAIGCIGPITNVGQWTTHPLGIVESQGIHIEAIPSLFLAQLNERLTTLFSSSEAAKPDLFTFRIFPNPVNQQIHITYSLDKESSVELNIYDSTGRKVKSLITSELQLEGSHNYSFDVSELMGGIYFAHLLVDGYTCNSKLIIQK
jgi:hypothetical protein